MKNWRNSEPFLSRDGGCRRCETSSAMKKIKDVVSRAKDKFTKLWSRKKKVRDSSKK